MCDEPVPFEAQRRAQLQQLAADLERSHDVLATDVVADPTRTTPVLEVTLRPECDGVRPPVMRIVAKHGTTIADVTPRGEPTHPIATLV